MNYYKEKTYKNKTLINLFKKLKSRNSLKKTVLIFKVGTICKTK
ncbi:hypothetical protein LEP1GSC079_4654 [Leptospira interrogans str. FPW1039]|uniref:Uncharacterized protein n=2 Tax=Leptospira interrogans TaxID=173 RepID=A0A0E2D5L1_LEPIR|nr:hypothetical protein LEP1GSC045_2983 [Leptospira interrogans serovar Pomona str. Kennewicki LC82-25]EKN97258.1 hypothetical protein LEP1GSC014_2868 [Leptospira interrogans serovar Pomona str. Pomona]EKO68272.1 hypothetical protein LEP1GSC069_0107 [Leptospira interrogans serovar Canicola str. Fiocruz LV133]EKR55334.1 hypothetical protein LEP1GSC105_3639 [Leptospira interrogans str. UI 12758]EMF35296.1 hypothetical protein LEP1GSC201_1097 [Leptospira interrogans serovar Pomona str. Fox 32256]